jgi:hypothetical protein
MKIDAHYYAVLGFCRACGFGKARYRCYPCVHWYKERFFSYWTVLGDVVDNVE